MKCLCLVCTFNSKAANANAVNSNAESTSCELQQLVAYDQHYQQQLIQLFSSLNTMTGVADFSVAVVHKGELVASVAAAFADWLNGFNASSHPARDWPVFIYQIKQGQRLLVVNKVGVAEFDGKDNLFTAKPVSSKATPSSFTLQSKISTIKYQF